MYKFDKIRVFWWSEIHLASKVRENFGDLVGKYLVEKIAQKEVVWIHPKKRPFFSKNRPIFFTVGSILSQVYGKCIVWGSGIISKEIKIGSALFTAVRGPQTRNHLIAQGHDVPEIYGDPALLLPIYYNPKKKVIFELGIIPHYVDFEDISKRYANHPEVKIIDLMTNDVEDVIDTILECKKIVSSSLHGIIVSHAYNIPAVWVKFSDKVFGDGIKYQDYFESVCIENYCPDYINELISEENLKTYFGQKNCLPNNLKIKQLQRDLLLVCPFKA